MPTEPITTDLMWRAALVTMLIDAPLVLLIARGIPRARFVKLRWHLAGAAFVVFAAIWYTVGSLAYWDAVYRAVFPAWWRWLLPLIYGSLNAALALIFWRASLMAERWQAAWFILFGGLSSIAGHSIGAARGLFRVPMLAEVSIVSALVFGVFEFVFYWSVIVGLAVGIEKLSAFGGRLSVEEHEL